MIPNNICFDFNISLEILKKNGIFGLEKKNLLSKKVRVKYIHKQCYILKNPSKNQIIIIREFIQLNKIK